MTKESCGKEIFHDSFYSDLELCKTWYDYLDDISTISSDIYLKEKNLEKLKKCFGLLIDYLTKEERKNDKGISW